MGFHGFPLPIKSMLTGGVEMPLGQLHLLPSNLDCVAFWGLDLHKQPNVCLCVPPFLSSVFGTQQGSQQTMTWEAL